MELVNIENPLSIDKKSKSNCFGNYLGNNAGRPQKNKEIKFSAPPKSIISLLLNKEKSRIESFTHNTHTIVVTKDEEWICRHCSYRSVNKTTHKQHLIEHKNKPLYCDFSNCIYSTKSSSNLIKHKRIHTSEKPYICDKCLFRTNFKNSLTVHQRIHTAERPYVCQYCQYKCNSSSNLKKHCNHKHFKEILDVSINV